MKFLGTTLICDRCNFVEEHSKGLAWGILSLDWITREGRTINRSGVDLCPACTLALDSWWRRPKEIDRGKA